MSGRIYPVEVFELAVRQLENRHYCPFCLEWCTSSYFTIFDKNIGYNCDHCHKNVKTFSTKAEVRDVKIERLIKK